MINALKASIFTTLTNDSVLTNLIGSGKISYGIAPSNATFPYVVFYEVTEQSPNDTKVDYLDIQFDVRCVGTNEALVEQASERIRTLLHRVDLTVSGWNVYRCNHVRNSRFLEQQERIQVVKITGSYRVTMNT